MPRSSGPSHRAASRLVRISIERTLGLPGTALFPGLARREDPLQANRDRDCLGDSTAAYHAGGDAFFWETRQAAFAGPAVFRLLFCRDCSVDVFFHRAHSGYQRDGGQPASHNQGIFSAIDPAAFIRPFGPGGFRDWLRGVADFHVHARHSSRLDTAPAALFSLLAVFSVLGIGLWLSALNALYRDVKYLTPFLVQFWMLASPVYYSSSMVPERYRWVYGLNPMAGVIDGFRWGLTGTGHPPTSSLFASVCIVLVSVVGGLLFFNAMEGSIADRV